MDGIDRLMATRDRLNNAKRIELASLEARNATLEEELARVKQCYLTLRECKGERNDSETELACGSGDIVRVECKKMGELREALRECAEVLERCACPDCQPDSDLCIERGFQPCHVMVAITKAREVLDG